MTDEIKDNATPESQDVDVMDVVEKASEESKNEVSSSLAIENQDTNIIDDTNTNEQSNELEEETKDKEPEKKELTEEELLEIKDEEKVKEVLSDKGFDFEQLLQEYAEYGEITKETREALNAQGISDKVIDNFTEGQKALLEKRQAEVFDTVGGKAEAEKILKWAATNVPTDVIASIDKVYDLNIQKIILRDLQRSMQDKEGVIPEYLEGKGKEASRPMFNSQAEMEIAIADPRYRVDEHYREEVRQKIAASRAANISLGC